MLNSAAEQPVAFVHRDYHSRNLMIVPEANPGIIDFQDAVVGPITAALPAEPRGAALGIPFGVGMFLLVNTGLMVLIVATFVIAYGFESDIDTCEALYTSLVVQMVAAVATGQATPEEAAAEAIVAYCSMVATGEISQPGERMPVFRYMAKDFEKLRQIGRAHV